MLTLFPKPKGPLELLCLGAHCDDIEIGCGGTLLYLLQTYEVSVTWVVLSGSGERRLEAKASADAFLKNASATTIKFADFKDSHFPYEGERIKTYFRELKGEVAPDLIFTHYRQDRHQDHRTVSDLTWNTFRNHFLLEYEIPKYDGDLGQPNAFVPLSETVREQKLGLLASHFKSQQDKPWYDRETFSALLRLRGVECQSRYAEAFYGRKLRLG